MKKRLFETYSIKQTEIFRTVTNTRQTS